MSPKLRHRYESIGAAVEASKQRRSPTALSSEEGMRGNRSWHGTNTFEEACDLALNGWEGARLKVEQLTKNVSAKVLEQYVTSYEPSWDTSGAVVDVEAFINGEPECMIEFVPEPQRQDLPVVTVLVNATFSSGYKADEVLERGAAICALVEVLMTLGFGVEVFAESSVSPSGRSKMGVYSTLVKLKDVNEYTDIDSFAFALAHPSWLRRIIFGIEEGETPQIRRAYEFGDSYGGGYGMPARCQWIDELQPQVVMERMLYGEDRVTEWIETTLKSLGVEKG